MERSRRTEGSVVWSSCKPSLLQSTLSVPSLSPWYLDELYEMEREQLSPKEQIEQTSITKDTKRTWYQYYLSFWGA